MIMLLWTVLFLVGIAYFSWQIYGRYGVLLKLRKDDARDYSTKTWPKRIQNVVVYAFGQMKFFRDDQPAGVMHIVIFWGFSILSLQVVTMFLRGWFPEFVIPGFQIPFIGGTYAFLKDIFQVGVILATLIALSRWAIVKPTRLFGFLPAETELRKHSHWEAYVILIFIMTIMISGFLYDAGRIVALAGNPHIDAEAKWQPISNFIAAFLQDPVLAGHIATASWWVHNLVILVFLNLLPRSKHFHIITSIPNVFFGKLEPTGKLAKKDYTGEDPLFGRSKPLQFTWKQALDMYSCTECGRCSSVCPATSTQKPLAPRQFLVNLRNNLYAAQPAILGATANTASMAILDDVVVGENKAVIDEVVWSCLTCRACEEACPVNIEYVDKIVDIRQHLTQEASRFPEEIGRAFRGMETQSNPWGISASERAAWAEGMDIPNIADKPDVEWLYYVGCGGSFDANNKATSRAFAKILKAANVSFAIMGTSELCNGESARRLGNEYLFQTMAEALAGEINRHAVKKILVNCPHCFNTLKNEYPDFGGKWHVENASEFVAQLIKDGKLNVKENFDKKVVYHDSCYNGRHNNIFEQPRDILGAVPGLKLEEMTANKRSSNCCGAGGGRMWMEEQKDQRVNIQRTEQALEKNPEVIATSCPYCRIMIGSGINEKGLAEKVDVMDVMEIVARNLEPKNA